MQEGSDERVTYDEDPIVTWPKPAPANKKTMMAMIRHHAMRHQKKPLEERAAKIKEYLAKKTADCLPLTIHLGATLIYEKPVPGVFKKGEGLLL
jgi:hypothetical protein